MKKTSTYLFFGLLVIFAVGVGWIFQVRLGSGDIYPKYSTLRADNVGLAAIYQAVDELPHVHAARWLKDSNLIEVGPRDTVIFAGMPSSSWLAMPSQNAEWLLLAARQGARVVIAFDPQVGRSSPVKSKSEPQPEEKKTNASNPKDSAKETKQEKKPDPFPAEKIFGVKVSSNVIVDYSSAEAHRDGIRMILPKDRFSQTPVSSFQLSSSSEWRTLSSQGGAPILIERDFGRGSIVLAGSTYFLTNESVANHEATALIAWTLGSPTQIIFDEYHLGLEEQLSIAALARRYGLDGAMLLVIAFFAFFVWRRTAAFVPALPINDEAKLEIDHTAGLQALMRRAVSANDLIETCLAEFKPAHATDKTRVRDAIAKAGSYPVSQYNAAVRSLRLTQ